MAKFLEKLSMMHPTDFFYPGMHFPTRKPWFRPY